MQMNLSWDPLKLTLSFFLADERKLKRNGGPQDAAPRKKTRR